MDSALRKLEVISQNPDMRMEYEARQKAIRDHNQLMKESEERGAQRKAEETARNMLARGFSTNDIASLIGLTVEQVEALKSGQAL